MSLLVLCAVMFSSFILLLVSAGSVMRKGAFLWTDFATLTGPFAIWLALTFTPVRMKSMSNLVELLALFVLVSLCFGLRVFAYMGTARQRSRCTLVVCIGAALAAYLLVPVLPE